MTLTQKRARMAAVIWGLAAIAFSLAFFSGGGPAQYAAESQRILAGAVAVALAGGLHVGMALGTGRASHAGSPTDERDLAMNVQASQATLTIVLCGVFASCIALWMGYRAAGHVPVGWMWFQGYGMVILAFLTHALCTLLINARMSARGRD